ncbi:MAG: dTDP-4-dehydrorhamnose 3,5-epimerase, partial [Planctomycetota bacterium]
VLRGLHYQLRQPQGKLVEVTRGEVFDVAVDLRRGSATFGRWYGTTLDDRSRRQLYIPPGFGHGFCVLSEIVDLQYRCTDYYDPEDQRGILWSDREIGIEWPISDPILSDRDANQPLLGELPPEALPELEVAR